MILDTDGCILTRRSSGFGLACLEITSHMHTRPSGSVLGDAM